MVVITIATLLDEKKKSVVDTTEKPIDLLKTKVTTSKYIGTFICSVFAMLTLGLFLFAIYVFGVNYENILQAENRACNISLVESIPEGLTFDDSYPTHLSTYEAWMMMLKQAKQSVDIVSFYWTLIDENKTSPTAWQGKNILNELYTVLKRGVKLRIIQNMPYSKFPNKETQGLERKGAEVLSLNMSKFYGTGILHTKFWVVDEEVVYIGSANTDWRSLTQVKEVGVMVSSCKNLLIDALKLVGVFRYAARHDKLPAEWPHRYTTRFNKDTPLSVQLNGTDSKVYLTSSPQELCPHKRTSEIDAILDIIEKAKHFINIAVMDYVAITIFTKPTQYWSVIDDALRRAAIERHVQVNFLGSIWYRTKPEMLIYLKSLAILNAINNRISIKMFCVPSTEEQKKIKFSRVNHNKYMITDNAAYISTSNWNGDYFLTTAGVSIVVNQTESKPDEQTFYNQLLQIFERDWEYQHSVDIWDVETSNYTCS